MTPALQIMESIWIPELIRPSVHWVIEPGSDKSHSRGRNWAFAFGFIELAFSIVRAIPITVAPLKDKTLTVSNPSPEFAPVTAIVLSVRSMDFVTSSAVVWNPIPFGPIFAKRSMKGI